MPMSNTPKGQEHDPEPGPNQSGINAQQGVVNDKQGDVNDEVLHELTQRQNVSDADSVQVGLRRDAEHVASEALQDQAAADAIASGEQRDAQHEASESRQDDSDTRQDASEATAAAITVKRDAQFQDQALINAQAVSALVRVGEAAQDVTNLLKENVARGRVWTTRLAVVVGLVILFGALGFWKFQAVSAKANDQRDALRVQATQIKAQAALQKKQAHDFCEGAKVRAAANKTELTFLVNFAIGENNKNPALRQFKADYPAHLNEVYPPVVCA